MKVEIYPCNAFAENVYLVYDEQTREAMLIDAGFQSEAEFDRVRRTISERELTLKEVLITHCHHDHVMGLSFVVSAYPSVPLRGSIAEQQLLPAPYLQSRAFGMSCDTPVVALTHPLRDGDVLNLGSHEIRVIDCPGHSFHGLCYYLPQDGMLFSGDVLFMNSIGRTDFGKAMGCDGHLLIESIVTKLMTLPPNVTVYPGHGPATTIGYENQYNPFF